MKWDAELDQPHIFKKGAFSASFSKKVNTKSLHPRYIFCVYTIEFQFLSDIRN